MYANNSNGLRFNMCTKKTLLLIIFMYSLIDLAKLCMLSYLSTSKTLYNSLDFKWRPKHGTKCFFFGFQKFWTFLVPESRGPYKRTQTAALQQAKFYLPWRAAAPQ